MTNINDSECLGNNCEMMYIYLLFVHNRVQLDMFSILWM